MPNITIWVTHEVYQQLKAANLPRGHLAGLFRQLVRKELHPDQRSPLDIADEISWLSKRLVYLLKDTR